METKRESADIQHLCKYLTFSLGKEEYGIQILKIREIMGYMDVTAVPKMPEYIKGVINLRGQVISVMDLRAKFGLPSIEKTDQTCVIVIETMQDAEAVSAGIIVDRVSEVLDITTENIEEPPHMSCSVNNHFILGMGKVNQNVLILLDIDKILDHDVVRCDKSEY